MFDRHERSCNKLYIHILFFYSVHSSSVVALKDTLHIKMFKHKLKQVTIQKTSKEFDLIRSTNSASAFSALKIYGTVLYKLLRFAAVAMRTC